MECTMFNLMKKQKSADRSAAVTAMLVVLIVVSLVQTVYLVGVSKTPTVQVIRPLDGADNGFYAGSAAGQDKYPLDYELVDCDG